MKRVRKIINRTIIIILGLLIIIISAVYFWASNRWSSYISDNEIKVLADIIEKSPPLSKDFYKIYDKLHPNHRQRTMEGEFLLLVKSLFFNIESDNSPCRSVYVFLKEENNIIKSKTEWKDEYKGYFLGWGIEDNTTPEKCFDYLISNQIAFKQDTSIFSLNKKYNFTQNDTIKKSDLTGVEKSSLVLFDKSLDKLNEDEIVELIVRFENPDNYDKKKKEKYQKVLDN